MALNAKRKRFAEEYVVDLNATQAAIRAGYSTKTARSIGQRLLTDLDVQTEIQRLMAARSGRTEITSDQVLREIARIAFVNPKAFFNDDGTLKEIKDIPDDAVAGLSALDIAEEYEGSGDDRHFVGYTKKIRYADKLKALELLGKHLGMFKEKVEVSGSVANPFTGLTTDELKALIKDG